MQTLEDLLQGGSFLQATVPSRRTCSSVSWSWAVDHSGHIYVLQHDLLHRVQGNICSCTWSRWAAPSSPSEAGVCRTVSDTSSQLRSVLPFLNHIFPEAPLAFLIGTAVSCGGSALQPVSFPHRGHSCRPLTTVLCHLQLIEDGKKPIWRKRTKNPKQNHLLTHTQQTEVYKGKKFHKH